MVAVYYYNHSSPYGMYVVDVEGSDEEDFYRFLDEHEEYPHPTSDVVILDGDKVVNQFHSKYLSE